MKRFMVIAALVLAAAWTPGCSKQDVTGTKSGRVHIESTPVYSDRRMAVYPITGRPSELAARTLVVEVENSVTGAVRTLSWDEAVRTVDDAAKVHLVWQWRIIPSSAFDPGTGVIKPGAMGTPYEVPPDEIAGGGPPPDPGCGGCWCCVMDGGVCRCSWGCLKDCYR